MRELGGICSSISPITPERFSHDHSEAPFADKTSWRFRRIGRTCGSCCTSWLARVLRAAVAVFSASWFDLWKKKNSTKGFNSFLRSLSLERRICGDHLGDMGRHSSFPKASVRYDPKKSGFCCLHTNMWISDSLESVRRHSWIDWEFV